MLAPFSQKLILVKFTRNLNFFLILKVQISVTTFGDVANSKRPLVVIGKVQLGYRACVLLFFLPAVVGKKFLRLQI